MRLASYVALRMSVSLSLDDGISAAYMMQLDRGSIRSSLSYGLGTPYRLTIRNSARLFHHVLFNMGDLHLVLPALNWSTLNAGILIMMQKVRLMMFSLNMVDYSMSFLSLECCQESRILGSWLWLQFPS